MILSDSKYLSLDIFLLLHNIYILTISNVIQDAVPQTHSNFITRSVSSVSVTSDDFVANSKILLLNCLNFIFLLTGYEDYDDAVYLCEHCNALLWYNERINKRRNCIPSKFHMCCMHGKIELPPPPKLPEVLLNLLFEEDGQIINFRENIRPYKSMFSFTSMSEEIDASVNNGRGPFVFRLYGQNFHQIGSLLPAPGQSPAFAQLYIFDIQNEVTNRISAFR